MPEVDELLTRIQSGDEAALVDLHSRYAGLVYSVALRILDDRMVAEEVTQDTFMRLWDKSHTYDPARGAFVPWLLAITRRLAIDTLRQRKRDIPHQALVHLDAEDHLWEHLTPDGGGGGDPDLRRTLVAVLHDLPTEQQDAIALAYFYGLSHSDIAAYRKLPLGTVKTRIRQGMQKLRTAWFESNPKHDDTT